MTYDPTNPTGYTAALPARCPDAWRDPDDGPPMGLVARPCEPSWTVSGLPLAPAYAGPLAMGHAGVSGASTGGASSPPAPQITPLPGAAAAGIALLLALAAAALVRRLTRVGD